MRTRAVLAVTAVVAVLVALSGLSGLSGGGALAAAPAASVQVSPAVAWPGLPVTVTGSGFPAGKAAQVRLDGVTTGTVTVGRGGRVSARLVLPRTASPGAHRVSVVAGSVSAASSLRARLQWTQVGLYPAHRSNNWNEHQLSRTTAASTKQLFGRCCDIGPGAGGFVVAEGVVVWATAAGFVQAIDATTGADRWRWVYDDSQQTPLSGVVYDPTTGLVYITGDMGAIFALDAQTGAVVWRQQLPGPANSQGLTLLNGVLYLVDNNAQVGQSQLMAFDLASRTFLWQSEIESGSVATPVLYNGAIYVAGTQVQRFDLKTGALQWTTPLSKNGTVSVGSVTADEHGLFLSRSDYGASMLDLTTGTVLWTTPPGSNDGLDGTVTTGGGRAYVEGFNITLALDETSGAVVWRRPSHQAVGLSYANGLLYSGLGPANGSGTSIADATTGEVLQTLSPQRASAQQPAIVDGRIYVPDYPMDAYALPGTG